MATFISANYSWPSHGIGPTTAQITGWLTAIRDGLTGAGLVQTSDTGQADPAAPPAWGANETDVGYMMFRFNDAAQATDPVFLRVSFGRGISTSRPRLRFQIGQGTNGSGTLTGTVSTVQYPSCGNAHDGTTTLQTYVCFKDGALSWIDMRGYTNSYTCARWISIERTRDTNYALDGLGISMIFSSADGRTALGQSVRWLNNATVFNTQPFCIVPHLPTDTSLLNGDKRLYPHWYNLPDIKQRWSSFSARSNEVGGTLPLTFTATPFGTTSRTFLWIGSNATGYPYAISNDAGPFCPCFLWEN